MAFTALEQKILHWQSMPDRPLHINQLKAQYWIFFLSYLRRQNSPLMKRHHIIVCPTEDAAENAYQQLKSYHQEGKSISLFPGIDHSAYGSILSSEKALFDRFKILDLATVSDRPLIIVISIESLLMKLPPTEFFNNHHFEIFEEDIISPHDLAKKLIQLGYSRSITVEAPGNFTQKGEIFDIYPMSGSPIRIHYFDDLIEKIFLMDPVSNKTIKNTALQKVRISASPAILAQSPFTNHLRENLPIPATHLKNKFENRKRIFAKLAQNQLFENYPIFCPLFFSHHQSLLDYFDPTKSILSFLDFNQYESTILEYNESLNTDFKITLTNSMDENILPEPQKLFYQKIPEVNAFPTIKIKETSLFMAQKNDLEAKAHLQNSIDISFESVSLFFKKKIHLYQDKKRYLKEIFDFIKGFTEQNGKVFFVTNSKNSQEEISFLMESSEFSQTARSQIEFLPFEIDEGLYDAQENILILCDGDLFSRKLSKVKRKSQNNNRSIDLFAEQMSTLKVDDFIIHSEHGLGIYKGLEPLNVGGNHTDYLIIHYQNNDKIYLPVYKLNQIQKYADGATALRPANLRNSKFNQAKTKAKIAAKKLAFDLIKLQAERQTSQAFSFSPPDHYYKEFELAFPFKETPDQTRAIEDVLKSMEKPLPMDHLICGDVGFGKTEIAMRAAFKAIEDKKQVAILVPTTILALQHFNSFKQRFNNFPVSINFLSRFKSPRESKEILAELSAGNLDIIIGTHKLLSEKVKFKDLGLVIVDEEQRFGVGHKEKLKRLKTSVDFLTLTATPIPRTMQLAFLGLRDLSLIQTAPPNRQSIKTYVLKNDDLTIKTAIEKELARGGQVFIVHNRVSDIELFANRIRELVPAANIVIGHGQLPERELEIRMNDFYTHKYQILIATTIIESGLDIPNANTLIINKANSFGLSQLHQLRGRVGRSDKKAYAYFMIPGEKNLTPIALKRLKALQTYADMGAGFSIASSDLEIRGAGDILGASQSGHIEEIGLELYMELLKEAVDELKGIKKSSHIDIEINTPYAAFIPKKYIENSKERLKYYKKLSNCKEILPLTHLKEDLLDIYGVYPQEVLDLLTLIETRIILKDTGMKSVSLFSHRIILKFDQQYLASDEPLRSNIIQYFIARPKEYQFTPDYKVIYLSKKVLAQEDLLSFTKNIAQEIVPC